MIAINDLATENDYVLTAAGGLPGEINNNWLSKGIATFDCEYGFSCMGYEISGALGAAIEGGVVTDRIKLPPGKGAYACMLGGYSPRAARSAW